MTPSSLEVTFLGTATLLISDGETRLLTNGFFTRPPLAQVLFSRLTPSPERIQQALQRAGIHQVDALLAGHSHYDHALDCAEVCRQTGAALAGSVSTLNIGRGAGLPEERLHLAKEGRTFSWGAFQVTFLPWKHSFPRFYPGEIGAPLIPPAPVSAYREGGTFALFIEHPAGNLLILESAGILPGALKGIRTRVVFLAVAGFPRLPAGRERLFREAVLNTGAQRVFPIHHDHFFLPLDNPPVLLPGSRAVMTWLAGRCRQEGIGFEVLPPWERTAIF